MNGFKCTIVPEDNQVILDGQVAVLSPDFLSKNQLYGHIHAVQFGQEESGRGEIEYKPLGGQQLPNTPITDMAPFAAAVDEARRIIKENLDARIEAERQATENAPSGDLPEMPE